MSEPFYRQADSVEEYFELKISGIAEVQRALFALNEKLAERVCKIALRQGATFMRKKIMAAAPVSRQGRSMMSRGKRIYFPPGRLKRATTVNVSRINTLSANGTIGFWISIYPGKNDGAGRADPKGAWYAKFVENGYYLGSNIKKVSLKEALRIGAISQEEHDARREVSKGNQKLGRLYKKYGRRLGRVQKRLRVRAAGRHIEGQHFMLNSFNNNAQQATKIIIDVAEIATRRLAQDLGLSVT